MQVKIFFKFMVIFVLVLFLSSSPVFTLQSFARDSKNFSAEDVLNVKIPSSWGLIGIPITQALIN